MILFPEPKTTFLKSASTLPTATPISPTTTTASTIGAAASATKLVQPIKASQKRSASVDAQNVKKRLFPVPSSHQVSSKNPEAEKRKCYKMKEDDHWTKLFSL
jgi:hypothetical protein